MDLISTLSSALGVPSTQAQAVAGALLGAVRGQVAEHAGPAAAGQLDAAVPELSGWQAAAAAATPAPAAPAASGGLLGGLMGFAGSGLGNDLLGAVAGKEAQEQAALVSVLAKVGLEPAQAMAAAPLLLQFLRSRVPPEWLDMAMKAAPMLAALKG